MIDNSGYWRIAGLLQPQHFSESAHRTICEIIGAMIAQARSVNPVTIKPDLPAGEPNQTQEIRLEAECTLFSSPTGEMLPAFEGFM